MITVLIITIIFGLAALAIGIGSFKCWKEEHDSDFLFCWIAMAIVVVCTTAASISLINYIS